MYNENMGIYALLAFSTKYYGTLFVTELSKYINFGSETEILMIFTTKNVF